MGFVTQFIKFTAECQSAVNWRGMNDNICAIEAKKARFELELIRRNLMLSSPCSYTGSASIALRTLVPGRKTCWKFAALTGKRVLQLFATAHVVPAINFALK